MERLFLKTLLVAAPVLYALPITRKGLHYESLIG